MILSKSRITIDIPDEEIVRLALERLAQPTIDLSPVSVRVAPLRIGEAWPEQGGIYAGIARGYNGEPDAQLIVHTEDRDDGDWKSQTNWAASLTIEGLRDFRLPNRKEQALLFANVPELFKSAYYWSCEQCAGTGAYAWFQYFGTGLQFTCHKDFKLRARAVRRVPI